MTSGAATDTDEAPSGEVLRFEVGAVMPEGIYTSVRGALLFAVSKLVAKQKAYAIEVGSAFSEDARVKAQAAANQVGVQLHYMRALKRRIALRSTLAASRQQKDRLLATGAGRDQNQVHTYDK